MLFVFAIANVTYVIKNNTNHACFLGLSFSKDVFLPVVSIHFLILPLLGLILRELLLSGSVSNDVTCGVPVVGSSVNHLSCLVVEFFKS